MRTTLWLLLLVSFGCSIRPEDVLRSRDLGGNQPPTFDLRGVDGPQASLCSIANVALCDGFEAAMLQSPPWYEVKLAAQTFVDNTRPFRGTQSFHVRAVALADAQARRQGEITETLVVPQPEFYFRTFVFIASPVPMAAFRIAGLLQQDGPNEGPSLFVNTGKLTLTTLTDTVASATTLGGDRWACIEWHVTSSDAGTMQLWLDDNELVDLRFSGNTQTAPPSGRVSLGYAMFGQSDPLPAQDIWFDEVIIDTKRIGCAR